MDKWWNEIFVFENVTISIRDKENGNKDKKMIIINEEKPKKITCCCFSNSRFLIKDYWLYVWAWDKIFHLIDLFNAQVTETRKLTGDPISISLFKDDYVLVGTNNREINFFSEEGIFVVTITQGLNSWLYS